MFDIGFLELFIIMAIALIVIGPARMPEVARKIGQVLGKAKSFMNSMKGDSELSSAIKEIKESINFDEQKQHIEAMRDNITDDMSDMQKTFNIDEEISRPTFGAENTSASSSSSQFNKAPDQPEPAIEKPVEKITTENISADKLEKEILVDTKKVETT